jgi:hypothetical protein
MVGEGRGGCRNVFVVCSFGCGVDKWLARLAVAKGPWFIGNIFINNQGNIQMYLYVVFLIRFPNLL